MKRQGGGAIRLGPWSLTTSRVLPEIRCTRWLGLGFSAANTTNGPPKKCMGENLWKGRARETGFRPGTESLQPEINRPGTVKIHPDRVAVPHLSPVKRKR